MPLHHGHWRLASLLTALWGGALLGVALLGSRAAFALAPSPLAGQLTGYMLEREAYASLLFCTLLFVLVRSNTKPSSPAPQESQSAPVMNTRVLLVLAILFCTVVGYFLLRPAMQAARLGQGWWSFGALHAVSLACFGCKTLLVVALAWQFSAPRHRAQPA
jgi:Domain of unknown function (DUF4149)